MQWIKQYQLFLFDFDGLLVNTENLHYKAYQRMCLGRGESLDWDWETYSRAAMYESSGLREAIYASFPTLYKKEPRWEVLYAEKKQAYLELLNEGAVQLMPGVKSLLNALQEANIKRCVVTHSPREQISLIRKQQPLLNTIPYWITRENYTQPKPDPECYLKAIATHKASSEQVIGFEDSPRGLRALVGSEAKAVLISSCFTKQEIMPVVEKPFTHFSSFEELSSCISLE